ncbi:type IV secretory system conjugative DNA transfer family protein [Zavarzinella formosa]|uniref:type IV secretory system conjugative DNA transfer family protein n=1 Tax=Zavarzinella formosa TaxID=360055 RepID=UPI000313E91F|nr:TraM recognition domain-containing protein [Zavarzinella formosa]
MWKPFRGRPRPPPPLYDPDTPILDLGDREHITLGQMYQSFFVCGGTGSGKTSSLGFHILLNLLRAGACVLTMVAKPDEAERIRKICELAGRGKDFRRIGPGEPWKIDLLNYELSQPNASVESVAALLDVLVELASRSQGKGDEPFWALLSKRLLKMSISAVWLGTGKCSVTDVFSFITTLAQTPEQLHSREWVKGSFAGQCLLTGAMREMPPGKRRDFEQAVTFTEEWSELNSKTRSIGITMAVNVLSQFMSGAIADVCSSGETNLTPEMVFDEGLVVAPDISVLTHHQAGQFLQVALKTVYQRAVLRRDVRKSPRPFVLWMDEVNFFLDPKQDAIFQSVGRSARSITVAMGQNLPLLQQSFGPDGERDAAAWIGNFGTVAICSNNCHQTNQFFSDRIGQHRELFLGGSTQRSDHLPLSFFGGLDSTVTGSFSEQWSPRIPPSFFATQLRTGGNWNGKLVDFICMQNARKFGKLPYKFCTLTQGEF